MYKSAHQAVGCMLRYLERKRAVKSACMDPNVLFGADTDDPDADALTVLILFSRYDGSRRALTRLYIRRVRFREIKSRRDRQIASRAQMRFLRALCHRGLIEFQGDAHEPHRSCRMLASGRCPRFDVKKDLT
jgi:hypothetical protein